MSIISASKVGGGLANISSEGHGQNWLSREITYHFGA